MRLPRLLPTLLLLVLAAPPLAAHSPLAAPKAKAPTGAAADETTELWAGSVYSSTFRATMCTKPDGTVRGVFHLRQRSGETDVYHVRGKRVGPVLEARHGSGHTFRGELDEDRVTCTVRLRNGMSVKMKGTRTVGVPVTDDCAPLPR